MEVDFATIGTIVLVVFQVLIGLVLLAGFPWAMKVQSSLCTIEKSLKAMENNATRQVETSAKDFDELFRRVRHLEISVAACPNCKTTPVTKEASAEY